MADAVLADIVEPAASPLAGDANYPLIAAAVVLTIVVALVLVRYVRRRRATAWVARLRAEHERGRRDARETAFLLAAGLRRQLGMPGIDAGIPPKGAEAAAWRMFADRLSALRYEAGTTATPGEMASLFDCTERWIAEVRC